MNEILKMIVEMINIFHDIVIEVSNYFHLDLTDKDLHLWVFGILGMLFFGGVQLLFKYLSRISITSISFIYTSTILVIFAFAIEIQQKITNRGKMDFYDAIIGIWGFVIFFLVYLAVRGIIYIIKTALRQRSKYNEKTDM